MNDEKNKKPTLLEVRRWLDAKETDIKSSQVYYEQLRAKLQHKEQFDLDDIPRLVEQLQALKVLVCEMFKYNSLYARDRYGHAFEGYKPTLKELMNMYYDQELDESDSEDE